MRGGARVLPGVRCFRGAAAVFGVRGAAVFVVVGGCLRNLSAALSLRSVRRPLFRRRSRSARFAAVFCGSHSACRTLHRVLRQSFRVPDFAPDFYAGRAPELLIFL